MFVNALDEQIRFGRTRLHLFLQGGRGGGWHSNGTFLECCIHTLTRSVSQFVVAIAAFVFGAHGGSVAIISIVIMRLPPACVGTTAVVLYYGC